MKTDPSKLPRIAKNQRALLLLQDEMIVFPSAKSGGLDPQLAAHAEVNPEPVIAREDEEHLFPTRFRAEEILPNESALQRAQIAPAKDPFSPCNCTAVTLPSPDPSVFENIRLRPAPAWGGN